MNNSISKSKLKAHMFEVFRQLEGSGEELIITDRNKPVLKIIPIQRNASVRAVFGNFQGKVTYLEDINSPTTLEWEKPSGKSI